MIRFGRGSATRHSRLQVILAIAAIGAAVALPVVLISVGGGVADHELAELENAGYQISISASGVHGISEAHTLADRLLTIASVTAASPVLSVDIDAFASDGSVSPVLAEGVIPAQFGPTLGPDERGLFPSPLPLGDPTDSLHFANGTYTGPATYSVLVSSPYASAHRVVVGDRLLLGPNPNASQGVEYNVTGVFGVPSEVLGPVAAFAVLLPLSDLQKMTGFGAAPAAVVTDAADTIQISVTGSVAADPAALARVQSAVQAMVPYYTVSSQTQEAQQLENGAAVLTGFYLALSSVGIAVGLIFLTLVLLRRVEADQRAIGIRRALGLPGRAIVAGILADGVLLAFLGSVAGVLAGYLVVEALARWATSTVQEAASLAQFPPLLLAEIVGGVVALSLLAAAVATRAALRLEITEALR